MRGLDAPEAARVRGRCDQDSTWPEAANDFGKSFLGILKMFQDIEAGDQIQGA